MTSLHTLIGAIACILCGALLAYAQPAQPWGGILITAGTGLLGASAMTAKKTAEKEKRRADDLFEQTQTGAWGRRPRRDRDRD